MMFVLKNALRILLISIYPLFVFFSFFYLLKKEKIKQVVITNLKRILINTLIIVGVITVGLFVFSRFEDTIYTYDYAGYWIKTLKLRQMFFNDPFSILPNVYNSMNNNDYSYLISLFELGPILIKQSFMFYCISNLILFLTPAIVLLQILYYLYFNNKYLPAILGLAFYPLWLTLFYGKPDCIGLFFLIIAYILVIFQDYKDITLIDNLLLNLLSFLLIFSRRWYLYAVVGLYLVYLIRTLNHVKEDKKNLLRFLSSGIILFLTLIIFFRPYIDKVLNNSFEDTYTFYNHDNKLLSVINFYSIIICLFSIWGGYNLFKNKKHHLIVYLLILLIVPTTLFWRVQSFDFHHFYIITLPMLFLFVYGLESLPYKQVSSILITSLLIIQSALIFVNIDVPLFTTIKKFPEQHPYKKQLQDIAYYIRGIETDESMSAYVASGSYWISDDMIRNSILPDIDQPRLDSAVLDNRDGFPRNFADIRYVLVITPTQYLDQNQQHMYDVISDAITSDSVVSSAYQSLKEFILDENTYITVYERTKPLTKEMKKYLYDRMIKYYPDKKEEYKYILD